MDAPILTEFEFRYAGGPVIAASASWGRGPVTVLFGPSGSGKTTILRCLAGLERPSRGRIALGGVTWAGAGVFLPPQARRIGYVPQEGALFPHLTVAGNIEFGLVGASRDARRARVDELVGLVGLAGLGERRPDGLSGGQRQRVALARALAPSPSLLLLDEPLSSLDEPTRRRMRQELRRVILASRTPAIVVTHDRQEALELGDELAVVVGGRLRQVGPIGEVLARPADAEVAAAVGVETLVAGEAEAPVDALSLVRVGRATLSALNDSGVTGRVLVCIRAEDVTLRTGEAGAGSARTRLEGTVIGVRPEGPLVRVDLDCSFALTALITRASAADLGIAPGVRVSAHVKAPDVHLIPRGTA